MHLLAVKLTRIIWSFSMGFAGQPLWDYPVIPSGTKRSRLVGSGTNKNTRIILMDNCYVGGESTNINRTDIYGNTYQIRTLSNGSTYEIMKNFFHAYNVEKLIENYNCDYKYKR